MVPVAGNCTATGRTAPLPHELCTTNFFELVSVVAPVVTVTNPLVAPAGTVASRKVVPVRVTVVAFTPLNFTTDAALNPCPRIPTFDPTLPEVDTNEAKAERLSFKL